MTIKDALIAAIGVSVSAGALQKTLADAGLNPSDEYIPSSHSRLVDIASIEVLFSLYGVSSKSEGDMSVSYNAKDLKDRLLFLARKYKRWDIVDAIEPRPKVSSVKRW